METGRAGRPLVLHRSLPQDDGQAGLRCLQWGQTPCPLDADGGPLTPDLERAMLKWAVTFAMIAVIAGVFGFGGLSSGGAGVAKLLFALFLLAFVGVVTLILLSATRQRP